MNKEIASLEVGWGDGAAIYNTAHSIVARIERKEYLSTFVTSDTHNGDKSFIVGYDMIDKNGNVLTSVMHNNNITINYKYS